MNKHFTPRAVRQRVVPSFLYILAFIVLYQVLGSTCSADYVDPEYQNRGRYWEGLVETPHSGPSGLSLISATIGAIADRKGLPDLVRAQFYLNKPTKVQLRVTDRSGEVGYLFNKYEPRAPWEEAKWNEFSWPSNILRSQQVNINRLSELAFLARLESQSSLLHEVVAPVGVGTSGIGHLNDYIFTICRENPTVIRPTVSHSATPSFKITLTRRFLIGSRCTSFRVPTERLEQVGSGEVTIALEARSLQTQQLLPEPFTITFWHASP